MARPLDDAISAAYGTRHDALKRTPLVDENGGNLQVIHVSAFVVLGVGYGRLQHFLHDLGGFLVTESQQVERFAHPFPADLVGDQAGFLGGDASARQLSGYFHLHYPLALAFLVGNVTTIGTSAGKFAQFMTNHVFAHEDRDMLATIVYSDGQTDHLRQDHRMRRPMVRRLAIIVIHRRVDLLQEVIKNTRSIFQISWHCRIPLLSGYNGRSWCWCDCYHGFSLL